MIQPKHVSTTVNYSIVMIVTSQIVLIILMFYQLVDKNTSISNQVPLLIVAATALGSGVCLALGGMRSAIHVLSHHQETIRNLEQSVAEQQQQIRQLEVRLAAQNGSGSHPIEG
jgi:hypothetical protein